MNSINALIGDQAAFERILSILSKSDGENKKRIPKDDEIFLNFEKIDYSYPDSTSKIFENVSCDFNGHKKYLVIGRSGIGKSTLIKLLERSITPTKGQILLNGKDIHLYDEDDYYKLFGFVLQDNDFLNFSIEGNLKVFNSNIFKEELKRACVVAGIHDFIESLPEGYNTVIGERGIKLSGGQRQRLAIARVILHIPKVLIFDEATCSIDKATKTNIFKDLETIFRNRLWIVIIHNVKMPIYFDYIVDIKNMRLHIEPNSI